MENNGKSKKKDDWPLLGNRHIVEFLEKSIVRQKLSGSYIFLGPDNLGKTTTAKYFAQILLCQNRETDSASPCFACSSCAMFMRDKDREGKTENMMPHGDFYILKKDKEKKNISISQVREFIKNLSMSSMMGNAKIGIVKHADALSLEASNALLKTLEEPKKKVVIILVAQNVDDLPKTILSRSQIFTFRPVSASIIHDYLVDEYDLPRSQAKNYSRISLGRPALAVKFYESEDFRNLYKTRMVTFANYYRQDVNRRLETISGILSGQDKGQLAVTESLRILEVWQGLLRDFLLEKNGLFNLMQHEIIKKEIELVTKRLTTMKIVEDLRTIEKAKAYLSANVNPRTVLENVVINIG